MSEQTKVDVLAVMDAEIDALERRVLNGELPLSGGYDAVNKKRAARAAVAELIEQRDALATALVELTRTLPDGAKSLSKIAQRRRAGGEKIAYAVFNHQNIDPEAYDRQLLKAGGL